MEDINKVVAKGEVKNLLKNVDTGEFIKQLEPLVNIWNHMLPDHHKKAKDEYRALAVAMKSTIQLCKAKYTNIRTYYRKERTKVNESKKSGSSTQETYTPSWPFYQELNFMAPTVDVDDDTEGSIIRNNHNQQQHEEDVAGDKDNVTSPTPSVSSRSANASHAAALQNDGIQARRNAQKESSTLNSIRGRKRRIDTVDPTSLMGDVSNTLKTLVDTKASRKAMDRYDHFGCMIAAQVRNLPTNFLRSTAMLKIQESINQVEFLPLSHSSALPSHNQTITASVVPHRPAEIMQRQQQMSSDTTGEFTTLSSISSPSSPYNVPADWYH